VISDEELAAVAAAVQLAASVVERPAPRDSRWKTANRCPELEMEEVRAL
jgi:hypothetical protein